MQKKHATTLLLHEDGHLYDFFESCLLFYIRLRIENTSTIILQVTKVHHQS